MELRLEEISKIIRSQIKHYESTVEHDETGSVVLVGDGIARVSGLDKCEVNELVEFPNGEYGMALNLEEDTVAVVLLGSDVGIREGDTVRRTGRVVSVPVGEAMIGRVVDALGRPIDGKGDIVSERYAPIESPAPGIIQRQPVTEPLQTGIKAIDSMIPIGRGQRELIIGDRQTGKTSIAARYHHQPEGHRRHLHLCGHRPEALYRGPAGKHAGERRRHGLYHRCRRHRLRAGAPAVHCALYRLHHGGILHASGQGCSGGL